jgi:hypothetical protein
MIKQIYENFYRNPNKHPFLVDHIYWSYNKKHTKTLYFFLTEELELFKFSLKIFNKINSLSDIRGSSDGLHLYHIFIGGGGNTHPLIIVRTDSCKFNGAPMPTLEYSYNSKTFQLFKNTKNCRGDHNQLAKEIKHLILDLKKQLDKKYML